MPILKAPPGFNQPQSQEKIEPYVKRVDLNGQSAVEKIREDKQKEKEQVVNKFISNLPKGEISKSQFLELFPHLKNNRPATNNPGQN